MEIHPRVNAIEASEDGGIWSFLVKGEKIAIIETGLIFSPRQYIFPYLKKLGISATDIQLILNTHVHFDHTGGDAELKQACNAHILIHEDEVRFLENPELLFEADVAPTIEFIMGKEHVEEEKTRYLEMVHPGKNVLVDQGLKDNDIIELGNGCDLKVVHLPGHTRGSVGFYMENDGILFIGDAMKGLNEFDGGLPIIDNLAAYELSLEKVQKMPLKTIVNSHPYRGTTISPSTLLRGEEIKKSLDECLEFTRRLREAVKSVAPSFLKKPFFELYDEVAGTFPKEWGLKPSGQIPDQFFSAATLLNCIRQIEN